MWALNDSKIDPSVKAQLSPIGNAYYQYALDGKVGSAALWRHLKIPSPASKTADSSVQVSQIAQELGFPVMIKLSRSGGGDGVTLCHSHKEIAAIALHAPPPYLVEKYIEGEAISVEALFLQSRLTAYASSLMTYSPSPHAPSLERIFTPCPEIEPLLQKLGASLQLTGFTNITFIRTIASRQYLLIELDFRPNRWIRHSELVGVDWSKALRNPHTPLQKPLSTKMVRHFPADLWYSMQIKQWNRIFYWLLNKNNSWLSIPFQDPMSLVNGGKYLLQKLWRQTIKRPYQKAQKIQNEEAPW